MYLLRKRWVDEPGDQAAHDVGEADERQRPARHRRRQAAEVHFARQMRHEKRDMESAGEEAGVQQEIAAVAHRVAYGVATAADRVAAPWCTGAGGLTTRTRGRAPSVITASDHIAPIHPSTWISACEIGAKTNCPNDPPALMMPAALPRLSAGEALRCCADQHREAAGARADRRQQAERYDEAEARGHEGRQRRADRQHDEARDQHLRRDRSDPPRRRRPAG